MHKFLNFILTAVSALLLHVGVQAQTAVYNYDLFDTVPTGGSVNTGFESMIFSKNADSVYVLAHNHAVMSIGNQPRFSRTGFIIAKCDTGTLTCDTTRYWASDTVDYLTDFYVPLSIFNLGDKLVVANINGNDWEPLDSTISRKFSIDIHFINENTLQTDSLKSFSVFETSQFYMLSSLHVLPVDSTSIMIGGWAYSDSFEVPRPAALVKVNAANMEIEWYKQLNDQTSITSVQIQEDKVFVAGSRIDYHPNHQTVDPLRPQFLACYDLDTGVELWKKEYNYKFRYRFSHNFGAELLVSNNRIYLMSRGGMVPIYQVPYRPMLGLRAFPQLTCLDLDGNELWTKLYDTTSYFDYIPQGITFDNDSNIVCIGTRVSRSLEGFPEPNDHHGESQLFITSWNKENGHENWIKSYDQYWHSIEYRGGILGLPTGGVIASGQISYGWTLQGFIQRFNPHGCQAPYNVNCPGDPPLAVPQVKPAQSGNVTLYPNPVREEAFIEFSQDFDLSQNIEMRMFDVTGQLVNMQKMSAAKTRIPRNNLPSGLYLIHISNSHGVIKTFKAVFQ